MSELQSLMTGLVFGESPRWHDGRLYGFDIGTDDVFAVDLAGYAEVLAREPAGVASIGFLEGALLVARRSGLIRRRRPDGSFAIQAELASLAETPWNDLVVDGRGNTYIGNIGFDFPGGEFRPGLVALVRPDGSASQVAGDLAFPNGLVVTPDNATLIVAETYAHRLTAFDIAADGGLSNRRLWADLPGAFPDGISLDAEGAIWYTRCPRQAVRAGGRGWLRAPGDRPGPRLLRLHARRRRWQDAVPAGRGVPPDGLGSRCPPDGAGAHHRSPSPACGVAVDRERSP